MYAVGIDVSKDSSTIAIIKDGLIFEKPFSIEHTEEGVNTLITKLSGVSTSEIKFVMEATGIYHLPLLIKLLDLDFFVSVENPFLLKKYFDVSLRKVKTDKIDAIKIANYCHSNWTNLKPYCIQDSVYEDLQFLSRQYSQFMGLKVKTKVDFNNLIDIIFPRFISCFNDDNNQYAFMLDVFEKFYHPSLITKLSEENFSKQLFKINLAKKRGLRTTITRIAHNLYSLANSILSARPANESTQLICLTYVDNLRGLESATEDILAQMDSLAKTLPEFNTVSSMSGVGKKLRARLIAEIGDIRRFSSPNSLIAYAGIDTPPYQSGNFTASQIHITKRGNKHLRKCGYEIMRSLKMTKPTRDTSVYDYILKKELEGKNKTLCKIAGLNKFLRIYYARVKEVYSYS